MTQTKPPVYDADEQQLAALGYKQELNRSWSGFSNFAISFSIISILAGCFTTFGVGWNNGGPAAIAWGWPVVGALILVIGFCMSELVSAFPTSGGIYWWASKLGGVKAGYYTGWLNLIGLLAIYASVAYGCATFLDSTLSAFSDSWAKDYSLTRVFIIFLVILVLTSVVNIFSSRLLAMLNNISVWWHVAGAALVVGILLFVPKHHASVSAVFTHTINNTGFFSGHTSGIGFLLGVVPLGFILTQYTITGYDASAHLSEETHSAADAAAKGIWRSIAYSVLGGWILLLAFLFAVQHEDKVSAGGGGAPVIFSQALSANWAGLVLFISTAGQFFCAVACMTSTTRMLFAFSRDGAVPGSKYWSRLNANKVPVYGVILTAVIAVIITSPALVKVDIPVNGVPTPTPVAFFAVVSIGVVGLYLAFAIPIFLRWKAGDSFTPGRWTIGKRYRWMSLVAVAEIAITSFIALLPGSTLGAPWYKGFGWDSLKYVNYTPIVVLGALVALWIGWHLSAKKWFTGPKTTIDLPAGVSAADEIALEHQGRTAHHPGATPGQSSP
ncbi:MAG: amino acid permease [Jatrophihabitans sp.]|uniref:amino acid permease n=1 Tax=Jatrophihabitans sp. TaxID=1932789 RepID=UPI003F801065